MSFKIETFKNRSGSESFRVTGSLAGRQVRRNFKTLAEAEAARRALNLDRDRLAVGVRSVATRLSEPEVALAERAFGKLGGRGAELVEAVEFYLRHRPAIAAEVPLGEAVERYLLGRRRDLDKGAISPMHLRKVDNELTRFGAAHPGALVSAVTPCDVSAYLEALGGSLKSWNNRRGILSNFFAHCAREKLAAGNPVAEVEQHRNLRKRRGRAETISPAVASELMGHVQGLHGGRAVNFYALCLFAGLRPETRHGEISKIRPADIDLANGVIHVEPEVSKTNEARRVMIQPNLRAWLEAYPPGRYPPCPRNIKNIHRQVRARFDLPHDGLRHTFISMLVARDRSVGDAALQAGNSEAVVRKHYLRLHTAEEAAAFWSILPKRSPEKVVEFR